MSGIKGKSGAGKQRQSLLQFGFTKKAKIESESGNFAVVPEVNSNSDSTSESGTNVRIIGTNDENTPTTDEPMDVSFNEEGCVCGETSDARTSGISSTSSPNLDANLSTVEVTNKAVSKSDLMESDQQDTEEDKCMDIDDISYYCDKLLTPQDKYRILKMLWKPDTDFKFPPRLISDKNRSFQLQYLNDFPWLVYSKHTDAAYCRFCFIFKRSEQGGPGGHQNSGLAKAGYRSWQKATGDFRSHSNTGFHKDAATSADGFMTAYEAGKNSVSSLYEKNDGKKAELKRIAVSSIIRVIDFLARQNIAFRGHRDSGRILPKQDNECDNEGNFRELLRFIAINHDKILEDHLTTAPGNAMYISSRIQNEFIELCGAQILNGIVNEINQAKCFSVMADETTDISTKEQLTVCVRYLKINQNNKYEVYERFLGFVVVNDLSGAGLADAIIKYLKSIGVDCGFLRGQSYDGARAMNSENVGVKTRIQKEFPMAIYTYCSNHCLNLIVSSACKTQHIRNMIGTLKEATSFFSRSALRSNVLKENINKHFDKTKRTGLLGFCETRWVERHDALLRFADLFEVVLETLEQLENHPTRDNKTKTKANMLLKSLCTVETVISLESAVKLFAISKTLSELLQNPEADLQVCYNQVNAVTQLIKQIQQNIDSEFKNIFEKAVDLCKKLDIEVKVPRLCKRQTHRKSFPDMNESPTNLESTEIYFRRTIFAPFIDEFLAAITTKFSDHQSNVCLLLKLLPNNLQCCENSHLEQIFNFYQSDMTGSLIELTTEFQLWKQKWNIELSKLPKNGLLALSECDTLIYPNLHRFLKILCTLPISVATPERTFSCLRRTMTYLRSTMGEERVSALGLLNINRDKHLDIDKILKEFMLKTRRLKL